MEFREFCVGISLFTNKERTLHDTLELVFHLYDVSGAGYIKQEEMNSALLAMSQVDGVQAGVPTPTQILE